MEAIDGLGFAWTLVRCIGNAVLVVVWIGTAVIVFERIAIFRIAWTLVGSIGDLVFVIVHVWTAIGILKAVAIFRHGRTLIRCPQHTITIWIEAATAVLTEAADPQASQGAPVRRTETRL